LQQRNEFLEAKMARAMTNGKTADAEDLHAQIAALKSDLSALSNTIADMGTARKDQIKASATDAANHLQAQGKAVMQDAQVAAGQAAEKAQQSVRENPAAAVGIATGLGFVLGFLTARK
jgi:ElaB/YqjD/DUF883 family membrane-anchored ribosome-binding protein